jgi:hypothetical protein
MGGRRIKLGFVRDGAVIASEVIPACADRPLRERLESVAGLWNPFARLAALP